VTGDVDEPIPGRSERAGLLAPAGDERALRAALAAGADAVYFGLERWSARAFAGNFAGDESARAVELAHLYGARAHLALNISLKDAELEPALAALAAPYAAGLDALIVADLGLAALVHERYPDLELHASTQLNTHSSAQLAALARLGFTRAILARELSLDEIAALDAHGLDLEAFVHGALCYGYSGDCLMSSMVGGRSGNRGRCSQSCRMRYGLSRVPDGEGDARAAGAAGPARELRAGPERVLSTGDLCALGALPALLRAGVTSFKIEGRMKDPSYVAVTTAVYRQAVDEALADPDGFSVRPEWLARLEQSFSRGFTAAHLEGRHDEVRSGGRGGHRGVLVGRVASVDEGRGEALVRLARPVAAGDVVYLYTPWGQTDPMRVVSAATTELTLRMRERVAVKDRLFRLTAAETGELARELTSGRRLERPVRLDARLEGTSGEAATLTLRALPDGPEVGAVSERALAPARTVALDEARVRDALGALGGTPYELSGLEMVLDAGLFLPVGELKDMRRRAVEALDERRLAARRRPAGRRMAVPPARVAMTGDGVSPGATPAVRAPGSRAPRDVVVHLRPGEAPVLAADVGAVCLDLVTGDPVDSVAVALDGLGHAGLPVRCRLPEVLFDEDRDWLDAVIALPWAALHARHLALIAESPRVPLVLEYPLQGLNGAVAAVLAGLCGRAPLAIVVSPEAAVDEVATLGSILQRLEPPPAVEVLAFGRVQVLRARDRLGRAEGLVEAVGPADHAELLLEDAKGYVFPAEVDAGGTRLYNARLTNLAANLDELRAAGVARFHVVQRELSPEEGRAFATGGLPALAPFVSRERTTTGHLFRGVA
jgi:U32 family peptidase